MKKLLTLAVTATLVGGLGHEAQGLQQPHRVLSMEAQLLSPRNMANRQRVVMPTLQRHARSGTSAVGSEARRGTASGRWRGLCSTWLYGERLTPARWASNVARGIRMIKRLIGCVFDHFAPGNGTYALAIAQRESGFYPWAQNVYSLCSGLFQHILSAWPSRAASYLPRSQWGPGVLWPDSEHTTRLVFDPRANAMAAAKMVAGSGWGPWGG